MRMRPAEQRLESEEQHGADGVLGVRVVAVEQALTRGCVDDGRLEALEGGVQAHEQPADGEEQRDRE